MQSFAKNSPASNRHPAFTLVEMLVVIAIISILMTLAVVGLNGMGGKGVTSGVATAEAVFDEARSLAIGKNLRTCVLVAKTLDNSPSEDLRRMLVAHEEVDTATGQAKKPDEPDPKNLNWTLSSRAVLLPEQTFFSADFSKKSHDSVMGDLDQIPSTQFAPTAKRAHVGTYYMYAFNTQGICAPIGQLDGEGMGFIIGSGSRNITNPSTTAPPKITSSAKKDFGGFVIWRNGSTSVFRTPNQMGPGVKALKPGDKF